ncbi:MAG: hypothetical protein F6J93_26425 [Oscillatoria sp. SIO1A7]|nr:hypothetical protein [Oscillatoria sp. SIO1A7]
MSGDKGETREASTYQLLVFGLSVGKAYVLARLISWQSLYLGKAYLSQCWEHPLFFLDYCFMIGKFFNKPWRFNSMPQKTFQKKTITFKRPNLVDFHQGAAWWLARCFVVIAIIIYFAANFSGNVELKTAALSVGLTNLIIIVVDFQRSLFGKIDNLRSTVLSCKDEIKNAISSLNPPSFEDYTEMRQDLQEILKDLSSKDGISLSFIAVAMRYSWPMIEDNIDFLLEQCPKGTAISIEVAMVDNSYLADKQLFDWAEESEKTDSKIKLFRDRYAKELNEDKSIKLNVYHYNNLPHWHGILINNEILFLGRTDWRFKEGESIPYFYVGQTKYRLFKQDDNVGGGERIKKFVNWFKYYTTSNNN